MRDEGRPWVAAYPPGINWAAPMPALSMPQLFDAALASFADRPCIDFLGRRLTYRELGAQVARAAAGLQRLGVRKGMRVALFLPNTPYYVVCYYAVLKVGGIVVNLNPLYAEREVHHLLADSGAEILVTLDLAMLYRPAVHMLGAGIVKKIVLCPMAEALPLAKNWVFRLARRGEIAHWPQDEAHCSFAQLCAGDEAPESVAIDPDEDVAVLQYTGGTTGPPKGAMLTHANLVANATQCQRWFAGMTQGGDRMLAILPFFHVFAMTTAMNLSIANGAEIVMLPRFELGTVLRTIHRKRPTIFPGVPTIFTAINSCKEIHRYDLSSLRFCISGGAPLPVEVKARFEVLTGCVLVEGYGLSEASPVVACNPFVGANKAGSVGLPIPGTTIEILALDGSGRRLPPFERGEVVIAGPQVMRGYWHRPEETARTLAGGRLHTGDVGYMDEEGYVFLVDRIKDLILCGGYNVYPRNVEEAVYLHPDVAECVVIGIPDTYRGQSVKAFVVCRPGRRVDAAALTQFLADKLSPIEMPKEIEFRASLPKTPIGKLSKKALVEEEAARRAKAAEAETG